VDGLQVGKLEVAAGIDMKRAVGISRCMIRALTSGMMGSSSPARIKVGACRRGSCGRLVHARPDRVLSDLM